MKIGLFFGSFNPLHTGHLIVAQQILTQAKLDRIWFVLSPQNPFKKIESLLDENKRLELLKQGIEENPDFEVCDIEFSLPKPSYTIDTLNHLSSANPDHVFSIILGSDNLEQFTQWKNYEDILSGYKVLVYARGTVDEKWEHYHNILIYDVPYIHISATYIRNLVKQGKSIKYLVPGAIEQNINDWYR